MRRPTFAQTLVTAAVFSILAGVVFLCWFIGLCIGISLDAVGIGK